MDEVTREIMQLWSKAKPIERVWISKEVRALLAGEPNAVNGTSDETLDGWLAQQPLWVVQAVETEMAGA